MMILTVVDRNGAELFSAECISISPTSMVRKHKTTLSDLVWGIFHHNKIGML